VSGPATLDHAAIAARVPHAGAMCLLDRCEAWDEQTIRCRARSHRDPANPLRSASGLLAPAAIEYASQAMALHGGLAAAPGVPPRPGFLAAARGVKLHVPRLDEIEGDLVVVATKMAGDEQQALYRFALEDAAGRLLVEGRATVVLNTPLPQP
jgi:predicted hotdog family 3-hydroxylacyl-ACP dehydratase